MHRFTAQLRGIGSSVIVCSVCRKLVRDRDLNAKKSSALLGTSRQPPSLPLFFSQRDVTNEQSQNCCLPFEPCFFKHKEDAVQQLLLLLGQCIIQGNSSGGWSPAELQVPQPKPSSAFWVHAQSGSLAAQKQQKCSEGTRGSLLGKACTRKLRPFQ